MHVHLSKATSGTFAERLRAVLVDDITLTHGPEIPSRCEVLIAGRPTAEELCASPVLRQVIVPFAGIPLKTLELLRKHPKLTLHNLHHNAQTTAEFAIALLLAVSKNIVAADESLRRGDWTPRYSWDGSVTLSGRRALVLGFGAIGSRVAAVCQSLGMQVSAWCREVGGRAAPAGVELESFLPFERERLQAALSVADVLMVTLPSTDETRELLDRPALQALPQGAILVNVARADIICEEALFEALQSKHLGGAGLDVWYQYPESEEERKRTAPSRFPFAELGNVVMSPHRAGHSDSIEPIRAEQLASLLNAAAPGAPLGNRVNLELGY